MRNLVAIALVTLCIGVIQANAANTWAEWTKDISNKVDAKSAGIQTLKQWRDNTCPYVTQKDACLEQYNMLISQGNSQKQVLKAMLASASFPQGQPFIHKATEVINRMNEDGETIATEVFKLFPPRKTGSLR